MKNRNNNLGFTHFELIFTIFVTSILAGLAIPSLASLSQNSRSSAYSAEIFSSLLLARSEAVTRGLPVSICAMPPSQAQECAKGAEVNWANGWLVFVDASGELGRADAEDEILRVNPAFEGGADLIGNLSAVSYASTGNLASTTLRLELRVTGCLQDSNRNLLVPLSGHPYVQKAEC